MPATLVRDQSQKNWSAINHQNFVFHLPATLVRDYQKIGQRLPATLVRDYRQHWSEITKILVFHLPATLVREQSPKF